VLRWEHECTHILLISCFIQQHCQLFSAYTVTVLSSGKALLPTVHGRLGLRLRGHHPVVPRPFRYGPFVHRLQFHPSSPEALHIKRHERPLLVKDGIGVVDLIWQSFWSVRYTVPVRSVEVAISSSLLYMTDTCHLNLICHEQRVLSTMNHTFPVICIYISICVCVCVCIYICIYIHITETSTVSFALFNVYSLLNIHITETYIINLTLWHTHTTETSNLRLGEIPYYKHTNKTSNPCLTSWEQTVLVGWNHRLHVLHRVLSRAHVDISWIPLFWNGALGFIKLSSLLTFWR
jgi:hypothetical protein